MLFRSSSSCLVVAFSQHRVCPRVDPVAFHQVQSPAFLHIHRLTHQGATQALWSLFRSSSSSSLCGDACCQLLFVSSNCMACLSFSNKFLAHIFLTMNRSHIFFDDNIFPECGRQSASGDLLFDHGLPKLHWLALIHSFLPVWCRRSFYRGWSCAAFSHLPPAWMHSQRTWCAFCCISCCRTNLALRGSCHPANSMSARNENETHLLQAFVVLLANT